MRLRSAPHRAAWLVAALCALGLSSAPAAAELKVTVSRNTTGKWQSVGITVTDPRGGLDAQPGPISVTMADGRDRRQTIYLQPTGKAGVWTGRFTPVSSGRFTGTAVLERTHDRDLGLVPLVRVSPSKARGFIRKHPTSKRALQYANGGTLFPIPVRLHGEDLLRDLNWHQEIARLRAHDVNFLEIPVAWPEELDAADREKLLRSVDRLLVEAEQTGRLAVVLRLLPPNDVTSTGAKSYREQLERWGRRWAYSPALAAWFVAGATGRVAADERASFVRAIRGADTYHHLVGVPASGEAGAGADLSVALLDWQRPVNRYSLLEVEPKDGDPEPLPGEDTWQSLVLGGVGLPIREYRPGTSTGEELLTRTGLLAKAAGKVPYQSPAAPVIGLLPADEPGSFCKYGKAYVGWVAASGDHSFPLPRLATGRYELLLWDPGKDRFLDQTVLRFDGASRRMRLPETLSAAYLLLRPTNRAASSTGAPKPAHAAAPAPRKVAAPKPATRTGTKVSSGSRRVTSPSRTSRRVTPRASKAKAAPVKRSSSRTRSSRRSRRR
jgi:hypothetical protein